MTFTFFTNCISPHQLPLAKQLITMLGVENYRYIYTDTLTEERQRMGWGEEVDSQWCQQGDATHKALQEADVVMSGVRALELFESRLKKDKTTLYSSERWFKPPLGFLRVFVPSYFKMAWRLVQCFKCNHFKYLPMGIHAARDMARLVRFLRGNVRCLFGAPKVAFESRPGGVIVPLKEAIKAGILSKDEVAFGKKHGFVQIPREHWGKLEPQKVYAKMRLWGYFVAPSSGNKTTEHTEGALRQLPVASGEFPSATHLGAYWRVGADAQDCQCEINHEIHEKHEKGADAQTRNWELGTRNCREDAPRLRVLWVGRMLKLKRVDILVKACISDALKDKVELHLYGHGPEEEVLKCLANQRENVFFHDFVPVAQVRALMRAHDVYVFLSNAADGWGAVVSEALEEGMKVLGTTEAGASATILPPTHLFKAGDVKRLINLLSQEIESISIGEWTAKNATKCLVELNKLDRIY